MEFSRQDYWIGLPCPPPGDLPDPGIEPASLLSPALAGSFFTTNTTWENLFICIEGEISESRLPPNSYLEVLNPGTSECDSI